MIRVVTWLLGVAMMVLSGLALADAKVFSMTGTATAQAGTAPSRALRVGDTVVAGETVSTAVGSTVVLNFPDGQIAALTPNTRMTITAYQYNEQAMSGNVLLSLISGGMRAVTGLIGRTTPDKVSYRAATATIGIRGTTTDIVTDGNDVVVTVSVGSVSFTVAGVTIVVPAGNGVLRSANGRVSQGQINAIIAQAQRDNPGVAAAITAIGLTSFTNQVNAAVVSAAQSTTGTSTTVIQVPNPPPKSP